MTRSALSDHEVLLAVIATQNEIAASALELDATMTLVCERALRLTRAAAATVEIVEGEEMVCRAVSGTAADQVGGRRLDARVEAEARARALSTASVPLSHRATSVGVLKVYSPRPHAFDAGTLETLELFGSVIAAHLTRAGDHEMTGRESRHDVLTGLGDGRAYEEQLRVDVSLARRHHHPLSLCLLDIDALGQINDRYGRPAGDEALRRVARALKDLRGGDQAFRLGGDEFAMLLPHTAAEGAQALATRLCDRLRRAFPSAPGIHASIGIAELEQEDPTELHAAADAALHEVKRGGSARVAV